MNQKQIETIKGHTLPSPRLTPAGKWIIVTRLMIPFLALLMLDALLYAIFRFGFDACYGVLCLL